MDGEGHDREEGRRNVEEQNREARGRAKEGGRMKEVA